MPLLPGKKNIGHNVKVEQEHGKPHKQAVAIALSESRKGKDVSELSKLRKELKQQELAYSTWQGQEPKPFDRNRIDWLRNEVTRLTTEESAAQAAKKRDDDWQRLREKQVRAAWAKPIKDDLAPVGSEDPERALALAKHAAGLTSSQDKIDYDKSSSLSAALVQARKLYGANKDSIAASLRRLGYGEKDIAKAIARDEFGNHLTPESLVAPVGADSDQEYKRVAAPPGVDIRKNEFDEYEVKLKPWSWNHPAVYFTDDLEDAKGTGIAMLNHGKAKDVMPVGDSVQPAAPGSPAWNKEARAHADLVNKFGKYSTVYIDGEKYKVFPTYLVNQKRGGTYPVSLLSKAKTTAEDELPTPIKPVGLVPLPAGEHNEESYAPRPVGDEKETHGGFKPGDKVIYHHGGMKIETVVKALRKDGSVHIARGYGGSNVYASPDSLTKATDRKRAADSATTPEQWLTIAQQREVQGDKAQALDSYRAAANGFRRASNSVGLAKATDGINACQARIAIQYQHPGVGRSKVCDSAEAALRTAIERTRAGERVHINGLVVTPGRAKARDAEEKPAGPKYNSSAVQKEINKDRRIGGKEAKLIHSLLKGRTADTPGVSTRIFKDEASANKYRRQLSDDGITANMAPHEDGWELSWKPELGFVGDADNWLELAKADLEGYQKALKSAERKDDKTAIAKWKKEIANVEAEIAGKRTKTEDEELEPV